MPIYEYKCKKCGKIEDMICKFSEKRTPKCECGSQMKEIYSPPTVMPGCLNEANIA